MPQSVAHPYIELGRRFLAVEDKKPEIQSEPAHELEEEQRGGHLF